MSEEQIKRGNIKLTIFEEFDFNELNKLVEKIQELDYSATLLDRGVIVLQKVEEWKTLKN